MKFQDISLERLESQQMVLSSNIRSPKELVHWLMAVQAQEYDGAKWSIGLRLGCKIDESIEKALRSKKIVRTWANRGTLHFVASRDIKWLLELIAPRLIKRNARRYNELALDEGTLLRSEKILEEHLSESKGIRRSKLKEILKENDISIDGQRFTFILQRASLDGLICQGTSIKNDPVYHSLVNIPSIELTQEESLEELTKRYFYSHGPATLKDFVWWSGLTVKDAKKGLESSKSYLAQYLVGNKTYWSKDGHVRDDKNNDERPNVKILPQYDDYLLAYHDRGASIDETGKNFLKPKYGRFNQVILVNGKVTGTWTRKINKNKVFFKLKHFKPLNDNESESLFSQINDYSRFIDKECAGIENSFLRV